MSEDDLRRGAQYPRNEDTQYPGEWWYYEETDGLHIFCKPEGRQDTRWTILSWRVLRAMIRRKDK